MIKAISIDLYHTRNYLYMNIMILVLWRIRTLYWSTSHLFTSNFVVFLCFSVVILRDI